MGGRIYLSHNASRARLKEAQNARDNRAEIVSALSQGQVTRRELFKWGVFTAGGYLAAKNGLNPFVRSAYGNVPTGVPPSPMFGAQPFTQPMPRLSLQEPTTLIDIPSPPNDHRYKWQGLSGEADCKRLSHHTEFTNSGGTTSKNPITHRGPMEGRAPGEFYAHQRWEEFAPVDGYVMSIGQIESNTRFHPKMQAQKKNSVWTFQSGRFKKGVFPPPLIKARYGDPVIARIYNNMPVNRTQNGGFGRNETQVHLHNAHNGSESDGANNCHFFPGAFYDYHWTTTLARRDTINRWATNPKASGPDGNGGLNHVAGDYRQLQGSLWFHDHRFFFTAENVYKGMVGMMNLYSGPDRGNEELADGVNLRLPSGTLLDSGNLDFDVNLLIADMAFDQQGQYFFDIFDTDGFLGDKLHVNFAYAPVMEVLPRKYRFRILCACMSRFLKLALADENGKAVPFQFIANDGNFVVHPLKLKELDQQGVAERYDIVVDFSQFKVNDEILLVNLLEFSNGRGWDKEVRLRDALKGKSKDPAVGPVMQFRVVNKVESVDVPGVWHHATDPDRSKVPHTLTKQIPIVAPVRERFIEFRRGGGDSRDNPGDECIPDCGDREAFPWTIRVNGESTHSLNANRISNLIPRPGEIEHWTIINGGGGWDHPIHLHFEEGITMNRGRDSIPATERLVRKDLWRLRPGGKVQFQVQFGEYGGAYVNHCHNTVHEDNAMLLRFDVLRSNDGSGDPHFEVIPTPNPTRDGVFYTTPEILPEGDPANPKFFKRTSNSGSKKKKAASPPSSSGGGSSSLWEVLGLMLLGFWKRLDSGKDNEKKDA